MIGITLPEQARVPDQWVVEKGPTQRAIIVPASLFSESENHLIIHVYANGALLCDCKGWTALKGCWHVRLLRAITCHKSGASGVQITSIRAYIGKLESGEIDTEMERVRLRLLEMGRATDLQISKSLNLPISSETARRNQLTKDGLVVEDGKILNDTGRLAIAWRALPI